MKPVLIVSFSILVSLYSCGRLANNTDGKSSINKDSINKEKVKKSPAEKLTPVLGYRFMITGDFDGDGKKEILTEHFISGIDHKETCKFYENGDYDTLVSLNYEKKPISLLTCNKQRINDLIIDPDGKSLGLAYIKNEGDLDGDGADEISYVADWADWSNVNFCTIMSYKNQKWQDIYSFQIRDWQLPDLPQTYNQYGIAGLHNKIVNTKDTAANKHIEKDLHEFRGLIKKIANYKIQIMYAADDGAIDTTVVDIRKAPYKNWLK